MNDSIHKYLPQQIKNAYDANQRAFWRLFQHHPQFAFHDNGNITWFETDIPHFLFNRVLQAQGNIQMHLATIDPIIRSLQQRKWPFLWHVGPSSGSADLSSLLKGYGLTKIEMNPMMAIEVLKVNDMERENKITIVPVTTNIQLEQWLRIVEFGTSDKIISQWLAFYSSLHLTLQDPLHLYLGLLQDQPVSTCALFFDSGVACLGFVATLHEYRHQGLATTMTLMALQEVRTQNYPICVLTASPKGTSIYNRIGFETYGALKIYLWTPNE